MDAETIAQAIRWYVLAMAGCDADGRELRVSIATVETEEPEEYVPDHAAQFVEVCTAADALDAALGYVALPLRGLRLFLSADGRAADRAAGVDVDSPAALDMNNTWMWFSGVCDRDGEFHTRLADMPDLADRITSTMGVYAPMITNLLALRTSFLDIVDGRFGAWFESRGIPADSALRASRVCDSATLAAVVADGSLPAACKLAAAASAAANGRPVPDDVINAIAAAFVAERDMIRLPPIVI